jgi:hypothetical protein
MKTPTTIHIQFHRLTTLCALGLTLAAATAQAQSSFTVNTLTGARYAWSRDEKLDNNHVAYGNEGRYSLIGAIVENYGGPGNSTLPRSAKWSVSTAATVSASRRFPLVSSVGTQAVSDDGVWQGLWDSNDGSTKRAKGGTVSSAPSVNRTLNGSRYNATIRDINNQGQMVGRQTESNKEQPYYWQANQGVRLDCGGCYSAEPLTINNRGEIGGWLIPPFTPGVPVPTLPAIWRNGSVAWTGDPAVFGNRALGVAMNDAGTLVVQSTIDQRSFTVSAAGTVLPLSPQANNVVAKDINASGVVVGSADGRATLWVNGQAIDLAAYLASKGVSQANTWTWLDIYDINDLGSMLVTYRVTADASGEVRKARLTAKP